MAYAGQVLENSRSPDYDAADRYDIAITGGANNPTIDDVHPSLPAFAGGH